MVKKPISGDDEQRRANVRASRFQSGLPPEEEEATEAVPERAEQADEAKPEGKTSPE